MPSKPEIREEAYEDVYPYYLVQNFLSLRPRPLYGRVDNNDNVIFLQGGGLTPWKEKRVLMPPTVHEAFRGMQEFVLRKHREQKIYRDTFLADLDAEKCWEDPLTLYQAHMGTLSREYLSLPVKPATFGDFIESFQRFLTANNKVFSFEAFLRSGQCSPYVSGLLVDTQKNRFMAELEKDVGFSEIVDDPNFEFYVNAAAAFGFAIDRENPWRLIFRVDKSFGGGYTRAYTVDFEIFRQNLVNFYNLYVQRHPFIVKTGTDQKLRTVRCVKPVLEANQDSLSEEEWLELYLTVKLREKNVYPDNSSLDRMVSNVVQWGEAGLDQKRLLNEIIKSQ